MHIWEHAKVKHGAQITEVASELVGIWHICII